MRNVILACAIATIACPAAAQTWYGRDIAASAEPIRTAEPQRGRPQEPGRNVQARRDGWRPQRSILVDPWGRVTVWAGAPPFWAAGNQNGYDASTPDERAYYAGRQQVRPQADPCASGIGGAASASAAIGAAASANGRRC